MATVLDGFLPMRVSQIRPGYGSLFTVDLTSDAGARRSLWIYLCGWAISNGRDKAVYSDNSKEEIDEYLLHQWNPKTLISTKLNEELEIDFVFDNSHLRLFPYPKTYGANADIFRFFDNGEMHYLRFEDKEIRQSRSDEAFEGYANISY